MWKVIATGARHRLSSGGWVANLVIGIILLLVTPVINSAMNSPKAAIVSAAIGLTILIWVVAAALIRSVPQSSSSSEARPGSALDRSISSPSPVVSPPATASPNVPTAPGDDKTTPGTARRVFTTRSLRELMSLYEGRTMLQADALIEPYKGLWISITAKADQIIPDTSGATVVLRSGQDLVNARFDNSWRKALGRVNTGETITVRGRLSGVQNGQQLYLIECEIGE